MKEEDQVHLTNIANYVNEIEAYVQGMDYQQFVNEEEVRITVMENLQHIGQAASLLSEEYTNEFTSIDLQVLDTLKSAKFDDGLEMDYHGVWGIITNDLPVFRDTILADSERLDTPDDDDLSETTF